MSHTPIPTPLPREDGHMVTCDGCLTTAKTRNENELPIGWIKVYVRGWIGAFHACSGSCEEKIQKVREIKSVSRTPIIVINK